MESNNMTQEEKAKAYDEALALAKRLISNNCTEVEKLCLECIFPELKESEDERIRKWLLECVENLSNGNFIEVSKQDVLSYLEKQKEQPSLPPNLDKAAEEYADYNSRRWQEDGDIYYDHSKIMDAFKAGAEWSKKDEEQEA